MVSVNTIAYLLDKNVVIEKLDLDSPTINAIIDSCANANWDVLKDKGDSESLEEDEEEALGE